MANKYLDLTGLSDFATKLLAKLKTIFATKSDVGAPLLAETVADMTDEDRIYVYVGSEAGYTSGNWYYWDGTAWTSGGTYNSQGIGDGEITTAKLADGAVTAQKIASGAVVNSVNGRTGAVTGVAEDDGYYDEMSVGSAEQLISSTYEEDSVPYVFRTSGGSTDIGDREFDEVHGGTVAFNQLVMYGNFANGTTGWTPSTGLTVSVQDNVYSVTIPSDYDQSELARTQHSVPACVIGHVYMLVADVKSATATSARMYTPATNNTKTFTISSSWMQLATIDKATYAGTVIQPWRLNGLDAKPTGAVYDIRNVMWIDLTQMFGSAIADYILALETATAGAGVAWVKALLPKPYYAYNTGSLISITGLSAHKMTGFNQWDEEWEQGAINTGNGQEASSNTAIRSKNYNTCLPNTVYCMTKPAGTPLSVLFYDADKNYLGFDGVTANAKKITTTPANACYFRIRFGNDTVPVTTYQNNVCINLHWDGERDGEYEEYTEHSYSLDSSVVLRGVPKLDADNKLYYDGDIYQADGTVQRRFGIVDLGTLTWSYNSGEHPRMSATINGIKRVPTANDVGNIRCSKYITDSAGHIYLQMNNKAIAVLHNVDQVWVYDTDYTDATVFKTAMSGVYLVYELATPTTESADPFTSPQWVDDWGTEEYVIAEQSGVAMPVGHFTKYTANLKAKLEMAPDSPSGNGDYIVRQSGGQNTYVPLVIPNELPSNPSDDGTYVLKASVSGGTTTLSWEVQS